MTGNDALVVRRVRRDRAATADVYTVMDLHGVYWVTGYSAALVRRGFRMEADPARPSGAALILWLKGDVVRESAEAFKAASAAFAALSPETRMYCLRGPLPGEPRTPAPGG